MTALADYERILEAPSVRGWELGCERVAGTGLFGIPGVLEGTRRQSSDGRCAITCWWENEDTVWIEFAGGGHLRATASLEWLPDQLDEQWLAGVFVSLMRGSYSIGGWGRNQKLEVEGLRMTAERQ